MEPTTTIVKQDPTPLLEYGTYDLLGQGLTLTGVSIKNDPYHQLEAFQLFAYFTANIIKEDVPFTR